MNNFLQRRLPGLGEYYHDQPALKAATDAVQDAYRLAAMDAVDRLDAFERDGNGSLTESQREQLAVKHANRAASRELRVQRERLRNRERPAARAERQARMAEVLNARLLEGPTQ